MNKRKNSSNFLVTPLLGLGLLVGFGVALPAAAQDAPATSDTAGGSDGLAGFGGAGLRTNTPTAKGRYQGTGFALSEDGRARLHLSLDAAAGFDTNPFAVPFDSPQGFAGDAVVRLRPGLQLNYPGSLVTFSGNGFLDYGFLPGAVTPATQDFALYQSGLSATMEVNRGGLFSAAVGDYFTWNRDPGVVALGSFFNRLRNDLRGGVGYRPGGERGTLSFKLLYDFIFEKWFDFNNNSSEVVRRGGFDQMSHIGTFRADWRFFPRTGAFFTASGGVHTYPFDDTNPTSFPIDLGVGVQGQFTPKLAAMARVGYGNPLTFDAEGIDDPLAVGADQISSLSLIGVTAQVEARYLFNEQMRLAAGFIREFDPVPVYQFAGNNRFYANYLQALGAQMQVQVRAGYSILEFGVEQLSESDGRTSASGIGGDPFRLDGHLDLSLQLDYFFTDWLSVGITNDLDWRNTNAGDANGLNGATFSYLRNETLLLGSIHY